jgi:catechol 2,3-dioxygenase-like lactoylglutathione lyase family enzyme
MNRARIAREAERVRAHLGDERRRPVISNERLAGHYATAGFDCRVIGERIHASFPDAHIFIVFREQVSIIVSGYRQYLRNGGVATLDEYLHREYDFYVPRFAPAYFNYVPLVRFYREIFGADQVTALPFELFRDQPAEFFERFGHEVGFDPTELSLATSQRHNPATRDVVRALFPVANYFSFPSSLNAHSALHVPGVNWTIQRANKLLSALDLTDRSAAWKTQVREFVGNRYANANRELAEMLDIDLQRLGYQTA